MYDIRQFRPALYLLLLLGISGFSVSGQTPGLWLLAVLAVGCNAWLLSSGRFRPMPRWIANTATLIALFYVTQQVLFATAPPLMYVGEFLVLLQVIKLFEQRANRDYGQILILSLLLMVAAAINTASLWFAGVLVVYLVLAVYCCLLFHLKVETDRALAAFPIPQEQVNPAALRQDRRFLARSMRRLTALVAAISVSIAAVVFVFFPRGAGANVLGPLQLRPTQGLTGFSESMNLSQVSRILQDPQVAAQVTAWRDGRLIEGRETLYLRGVTHDRWTGRQWGGGGEIREEQRLELPGQSRGPLFRGGPEAPYRLKVNLNPARSNALFTLAGPVSFRPAKSMTVRLYPQDETLASWETIDRPIEYEVWCENAPAAPPLTERLMMQITSLPPRSNPEILAEIGRFTRRAEVIGESGMQRPPLLPLHPGNREIAQRIASYLQSNYSYTLDLTDAPEMRDAGWGGARNDPYVLFLTQTKRGHCWYFAGSMVLMCQSVGIPARLVGGYRCDSEDYNSLGNYYTVRHLHAHAWVEVLTAEGWEVFDPTSSRALASGRPSGWLKRVKDVFDYLQFKWGQNVVAFDRATQDRITSTVEGAASRFAQWIQSVRGWFGSSPFWTVFTSLLGGLIALMVLIVLAAIVAFFWLKVRLRRRARRIGMDSLPVAEQIRLARQLAFYDELMSVLARQNLHRPRQLTHREFAETLTFLPAYAFAAIRRLTDVLYRVRFGGAQLRASRQRRLLDVVERLAQAMEAARPQGRA